jgi:hypothetical protein
MWAVRRRARSHPHIRPPLLIPASQLQDATISYVSGPFISNAEKYLLVKDGKKAEPSRTSQF